MVILKDSRHYADKILWNVYSLAFARKTNVAIVPSTYKLNFDAYN